MSKIVSFNSAIALFEQSVQNFTDLSGINAGKNNLYISGKGKEAKVTNFSDYSKFFAGDQDNDIVIIGDHNEIETGKGYSNVVAKGSNMKINLGDANNRLYFEGNDTTIKLGKKHDYAVLSGSNINFDAGDGNNTIKSGSLGIKLDKGKFFIEQISSSTPSVKDEDILAAFGED